MSLLRAILHELIGLFVDDGALAFALVAWCALLLAANALLAPPPILSAAALALGCAVILLVNVVTSARKRG